MKDIWDGESVPHDVVHTLSSTRMYGKDTHTRNNSELNELIFVQIAGDISFFFSVTADRKHQTFCNYSYCGFAIFRF